MSCRLGDKVWVPKSGVRHYGIVVGVCAHGVLHVVHASKATGVVEEAPLHVFAGAAPVTIEQRAPRGHEYVVARRATSLIGRRYDLLSFNCEHAATYAMTGRARSAQLGAAVFLGLLGLGVGLALARV